MNLILNKPYSLLNKNELFSHLQRCYFAT